jgi:hypothetical protein
VELTLLFDTSRQGSDTLVEALAPIPTLSALVFSAAASTARQTGTQGVPVMRACPEMREGLAFRPIRNYGML